MPLFTQRPVIRTARDRPVAKPKEPARKPHFDPVERFEMIIEWAACLNKNPRIQRLGFKAEGTFAKAFAKAEELTRMLNSAQSQTLEEINSSKFCRLIAVYEERAFKSYEAEPLYNPQLRRQAVQQHVARMQAIPDAAKVDGRPVKNVRVR